MLKVQEYLRKGNPLDSLSAPPYNLIVKEEENNLVLLTYNQLTSDFNEPICRECRGLILRKPDWIVIAAPFYKFFNVNEPYADKLDTSELFVYEKIDGSLIKLYYYQGQWNIATRNTIDADTAIVGENSFNFISLFNKALGAYGLTWQEFTSALNKDYTYMYELATQDNPVIIKYKGYHIYYLGQRNNITLQEEYNPDERIENVKTYKFKTIDDIMAAAHNLTDNEEGYVVRDKYFNRVKVKNPKYLLLHKTYANGKPNLLSYVLENNTQELLSYFPQFKPEIDKIIKQFRRLNTMAMEYKNIMKLFYDLSRKDFAQRLVIRKIPPYLQSFIFCTYDNHDLTWQQYTSNWTIEKWKGIYERAKGDLIV